MDDRALGRLRQMLASRQQEKAELELEVRSFESRLRAEMGPLQERVLRLQMERLKEAAQSQMQNARLRNAYHDARETYERFAQQIENWDAADRRSEQEVQSAYRRASKQCHPDAVPEPYREEAAATFRALETAYQEEHGPAVEAIAEALEAWGFPDHSVERGEEEERSERVRQAVESLQASIEAIRSTDLYQVVEQSPDIETAVEAQKQHLVERVRTMQGKKSPRGRRRR